MTTATRRAVTWGFVAALAWSGSARAQVSDATMTVTLRAAGAGQFDYMGRIATQVRVYAESGVSARWSGPTNVYAPTVGAVSPGGTFTVTVPSLYSTTRVPGNVYTVQLYWADTTMRTLSAGTVTPRSGSNTAGPYTVTNDPPPGATSIACYADPTDATAIYVYWSGPSPRPTDFDRMELHRASTSGFTPSSSTFVTSFGFGASNSTVRGLSGGDHYFCLRVIDQYGATTDRCTTSPCRVMPRDAGPDVVDVVMPDVVTPDVVMPDVVMPTDIVTPDVVTPTDIVMAPDVPSEMDVATTPDVVLPADRGSQFDDVVLPDSGTMTPMPDSGVLPDSGAMMLPDGAMMPSDGAMMLPDGAMVLPDGAMMPMPDSGAPPDGGAMMPMPDSGAMPSTDASVGFTDAGATVLADGAVIGLVRLQDGAVVPAWDSGATMMTLPDGAAMMMLPDGAMMPADVPSAPDDASEADGGFTANDPGGCKCRAGATSNAPRAPWWTLALVALRVRRRRRAAR